MRTNIHVALLISCFIAALHAQQDTKDLLASVKHKVMDSVNRLPKYVCTQTIERQQYEPVRIDRANSCGRVAAERAPGRLMLRLTASDRLRLDVATATGNANREMYSWAGEQRFEDSNVGKVVRDGTISNGSFSTFLNGIFKGDSASFSDEGDVTVEGRLLHQFGFQIPLDRSDYSFGNRRVDVKTAYRGVFLVDAQIADLIRLTFTSSELPAETGSCNVTQTMDYGRVRLNGEDFLLPNQTQLKVTWRDGTEMDNRTVYSSCHEFRGESAISFEPPPEANDPAAANTSVSPSTALSVGLQLRLALTKAIDTATAATGDPVQAKLVADIRDTSSRMIAPAGAVVSGRIMAMLFSYGQRPSLKLAIRWESLMRGGASQTFAAKPWVNFAPITSFKKEKLAKRGVELGTLQTMQDGDAGVFDFEGAKPGFVVPIGTESSWLTAVPEQQ